MSSTEAGDEGGKRPAEDAPDDAPDAKKRVLDVLTDAPDVTGKPDATEQPDATDKPDIPSTEAEAEAASSPVDARVDVKTEGYQLGYKKFANSKEIIAFLQNVLTAAPQDVLLNEYEHLLLRDLIRAHPRARAKIGNGIIGFKKRTVQFGSTSSTCFFAIHKDGREEDFSYLKCVSHLTKEEVRLRPARASHDDHRGGRGRGHGRGRGRGRGGGRW
jgi:hypothetical protein